MRVALFLTCVNDTLYPDTGRAVVKLLTRLGVDVDFPMAPDLLRAGRTTTPGTGARPSRWPGSSPMSSGGTRRS